MTTQCLQSVGENRELCPWPLTTLLCKPICGLWPSLFFDGPHGHHYRILHGPGVAEKLGKELEDACPGADTEGETCQTKSFSSYGPSLVPEVLRSSPGGSKQVCRSFAGP